MINCSAMRSNEMVGSDMQMKLCPKTVANFGNVYVASALFNMMSLEIYRDRLTCGEGVAWNTVDEPETGCRIEGECTLEMPETVVAVAVR